MTEFQNNKNKKTEKLKTEKIAILSVLKPVHDVRAYQKIAKSIVHNSDNSKKVTLIGFEKSSNFNNENTNLDTNSAIDFIELFTSKKNATRLGLWRFFAGFKVFNQLLKLKPTTIIVCAVELLPFTLLFKFLFNSKLNKIKLIYDVQENYAFNILYQDNYPRFLKKILAFLIRSFEELSSPFIDLYLLAERCYLEEMPFLKKTNYLFLENKFLPSTLSSRHFPSVVNSNSINNRTSDSWNSVTLNKVKLSAKEEKMEKEITFLIYGSFSKTYGTLEGILFFKKLEQELQKQGFSARLILAGYCSDKDYSKQLIEVTENESSILLVNKAIDKPISHNILLYQLQKTDFVILPYLFNKSTQNCIPTKFYECLAYKKPMLISGNGKWESEIEDWGIEIGNKRSENEIQSIVEKILSQKFYTKPIDEKIWKFDVEILRKMI